MYNKALDDLFDRYCTNTITEEELYRLFDLLSDHTHDEQLKGMLEAVWDKLPRAAGVQGRTTPALPGAK
ncbi:MAG TPA: hypothetical protein VGC22_13105 [Chitinophaga sp.]